MASLFSSSNPTTTASTSPSINLSLYTIPLACLLSIGPHIYAIQLYEKSTSRTFDNCHPRSLTQTVTSNQNIDSATKGRILRAEAAQQNGFENVGLFASAVVAGNMARLDNSWLNLLSVGYVLSRVVYNVLYVNNTTAKLAAARSVVFISGTGMIWTLFFMAGNRLRHLA